MADSLNGQLRGYVVRMLDWEDAHVSWDNAVKDLAPELRGIRPEGSPRSVWELSEHIRIAQHDILSFCIEPAYRAPKWPDDYWPKSQKPPNPHAWDEHVQAMIRDREAMKELALDNHIDLFAKIPHGKGQTYLRELLLVADHASYHVGQIVDVRRRLGAWR